MLMLSFDVKLMGQIVENMFLTLCRCERYDGCF